MRVSRSIFMMGTGASGEIRLTLPYRNLSSITSPMQRIRTRENPSINVCSRFMGDASFYHAPCYKARTVEPRSGTGKRGNAAASRRSGRQNSHSVAKNRSVMIKILTCKQESTTYCLPFPDE